jgi:hypothetical protein
MPRKHRMMRPEPLVVSPNLSPVTLHRPRSVQTKAGEDALPAWFAAQTKKIPDYALWLVQTRETRQGADPEYEADPRGVLKRRVARAVAELLRFIQAYDRTDELARLRALAGRLRQHTRISLLTDNRAEEEIALWYWSFHLCGRWLEAGEATVFVNLPYALQADFFFFLGQWWVRFLLQSMRYRGEHRNMELLLYGEKKKGRPMSDEVRFQLLRRNEHIRKRSKELTAQGISHYRADRVIAREVGRSPSHVTNIRLGHEGKF